MADKFQIDEGTRCFVCLAQATVIDFIHPETEKTLYFSKSRDDLLETYPDVSEMSLGEFMTWKAAQQRTPIAWNEEIPRDRFISALECLPPAAGTDGWRDFLIGEPYDHDALNGEPRYQGYRRIGKQYFQSSRPITVTEFRAEVGDTL